MQVRQRIFKWLAMQVRRFFFRAFWNFWHNTRLFTTNRRKVINAQTSPVFWTTLYMGKVWPTVHITGLSLAYCWLKGHYAEMSIDLKVTELWKGNADYEWLYPLPYFSSVVISYPVNSLLHNIDVSFDWVLFISVIRSYCIFSCFVSLLI